MADQALNASPQLHADFWQLGSFARPGLTSNNRHLVVADGLQNVLLLLADRQILWIANFRTRCRAPLNDGRSLSDLLGHLAQDGLLSFRIFNLLHTVQTTGEALPVAEHEVIEVSVEVGEGQFLLFCHSVIGQ